MTYTSLLINECDVERYTEGAVDGYGHPVRTWAVHLDDIACRIQDAGGVGRSGREITVGAEVVIADYKLFLGDVDVTEQDRVVLDSVTYEILMVTDKQDSASSHHLECYLRTVR